MKVLEELLDRTELNRSGFTHFVGLTYGVDLAWFEHHLRRQLEIAGVRQVVVLADRRALDATLAAQASELRDAGRAFVVQGVQAVITFHPKAYLLAGPRRARLYVGSGNLNESGLARNREMFERWDARPDRSVPRAFDAFRAWVGTLLQGGGTMGTQVEPILQGAFALAPFGGPFADQGGTLYGSPGPLHERLPSPLTPATHLVMTAPFFDDGGKAARDLAAHLRADRYEVLVDRTMTNLSARARAAIEASGGKVRALTAGRRSHAKAIFAEGTGWAFSAHGSANLSLAAWRGHNTELMVFRADDAAREVGELVAELEGDDLTEGQWAEIHERAARTGPPETDPTLAHDGLILDSARWLPDGRLEATLGGPAPTGTVLQLRVGQAEREFALEGQGLAGPIALRVELEVGPVAVARLVAADRSGPWCLVHDPAALKRAARGRSALDDRVERLVLHGGRDPEGGGDLVELITEIMRLRSEAKNDGARAGPPRRTAPREDGPEWRWIRPAETPNQEKQTVSAINLSDLTGLNVDPVRLLERLLLGDARAMLGRVDVDGTDADAEAKGATPGARIAEPPARSTSCVPMDLMETTERARSAFVSALVRGGGDLPPESILADVLVLASGLQSGLQQGRLTDRAYVHAMRDVLRAAFGSRNAPLVRALERIPPEKRERTWARGWLLVGPLVVLWQVLLAHEAATNGDGVEDAPRRTNLVLWIRHLLRHRPTDATADGLLAEAKRQLPTIEKFGALWLGDRWPGLAARLPFLDFARVAIEEALAVLAAEPILEEALKGAKLARLSGVVEGDDVIGLGPDGSPAKGFMDDAANALVHDGAFQAATRRDVHFQLRKLSGARVITVASAVALLRASAPELQSAAAVLERMEG